MAENLQNLVLTDRTPLPILSDAEFVMKVESEGFLRGKVGDRIDEKKFLLRKYGWPNAEFGRAEDVHSNLIAAYYYARNERGDFS